MLPLRRALEIQQPQMVSGTPSEVLARFHRAGRCRVLEAPAWALRRSEVQRLAGIRSPEATDSEERHLARDSVIAGLVATAVSAADGAAVSAGEDAGTAVGVASVGAGVLGGVTQDGVTLAWPGAVTGILTGTIHGGAGIITTSDTTPTTRLGMIRATRSIPDLRTRPKILLSLNS
jgi:hypothetical protein